MINYKVLFITNSCFSKTEANGRTLEALFGFIPRENLAQFYVRPDEPDFDYCLHYFRVTDADMMRCFYKRTGGVITEPSNKHINISNSNKGASRRSPIRMIARNMLWRFGFWKKRSHFDAWVDNFGPDLIVTMVGDSSFIFNIAIQQAKRNRLPILVYNAEAYYFKKHNYFTKKPDYISSVSYKLFHFLYNRQYERLMKYSQYVIYGCWKIENAYTRFFDIPHSTIFMPTSGFNFAYRNNAGLLKITYAGNLGLNRHLSLMSIGLFLSKKYPNLKIDVYGSCNEQIKNDLISSPGISYKGFVSRKDLDSILEDSDILIHVESFDDFYVRDIEYGFSTKIADSIGSNRCLFVYAPEVIACNQYIASICPGCSASSKDEMEIRLSKLIEDENYRRECVKEEMKAAQKNHSKNDNNSKLERIINQICSNK